MSKRGLKVKIKDNQISDFEYIGGRNLVDESLKSGRKFKKIIFDNSIKLYSNDDRINDIIAIAKEKSIGIEYVDKHNLYQIENEINIKCEGVAGIVEKREELDIEDLFALCKSKNKEPFIIIINNILYEENLGAVLRTCAAGGVDGIIIPKRDKRYLTPNVARVSMGGSEYVPLIKENLFSSIDRIKEEGIKVIGVELSGSSYYFEEDLKGPLAIIIGGEDAGISSPLQKRCDKIVKIPMLGKIQSLNLSVSTGIIIYEKIRQECQI